MSVGNARAWFLRNSVRLLKGVYLALLIWLAVSMHRIADSLQDVWTLERVIAELSRDLRDIATAIDNK